MHHPTGRITYTSTFVTQVVEHWLEREIAQWVHHEGSIRRSMAPWANALTCMKSFFIMLCSMRRRAGSYSRADGDRIHLQQTEQRWSRERNVYLTTHSTHFIYGYMASDIWLRTILIVRKETRCRHTGYSYWLTARVLLYGPSHRQDNTYHSLCYTSHGALAGTRNNSMGPPHEGSIRRPTAPWANALPLSYVPLLWWSCFNTAISVKKSNLLIWFCSFDLSCSIFENNFIKIVYIVLYFIIK